MKWDIMDVREMTYEDGLFDLIIDKSTLDAILCDEEALDITVAGAALGDFVLASLSIDVADLALSGAVTAADTVTLVLSNNTGAGVNLGAATAYCLVLKKA